MVYDVAIIGAGVIGSTLARELSRYKLSVAVLEKENDVACGASKANSGIIHGGYDPEPGTLKAQLNTSGIPLLYEAAAELNVPHKNNGSMVVAFGEEQEAVLTALYERGLQNSITALKLISGDEARKTEPMLSPDITMVLLVENAGIICPYELTIAAMGNAMDNGVQLIRNFEVTSIAHSDTFKIVSTNNETVECRYAVNCAGVYADKISAMIDDGSFKIIPRAGEYMLLDKSEGTRVAHTIFQVPSKEGKGILVSPTADSNLLIGPTAHEVEPENTATSKEQLDIVERLAKKSVPSVNTRQVITSFAGVRASEKNGDFIISPSEKNKKFINVAAIDSPGLTSCIAIAKYVLDLLFKSGLRTELDPSFDGRREDPHIFKKMSNSEKNAYIKEHPAYGRIICRCETVSEGEIRDAINRNPRAFDIDGVKRRTRSGMGRCQGGFCSTYVMRLLSEENNIELTEITKKGNNSKTVIGAL